MKTPFAALLGNAANGFFVCFVSSAVCRRRSPKSICFLSFKKRSAPSATRFWVGSRNGCTKQPPRQDSRRTKAACERKVGDREEGARGGNEEVTFSKARSAALALGVPPRIQRRGVEKSNAAVLCCIRRPQTAFLFSSWLSISSYSPAPLAAQKYTHAKGGCSGLAHRLLRFCGQTTQKNRRGSVTGNFVCKRFMKSAFSEMFQPFGVL